MQKTCMIITVIIIQLLNLYILEEISQLPYCNFNNKPVIEGVFKLNKFVLNEILLHF